MNAEFPSSREALEARVTALILGELPTDEAEALRAALALDAELARLHERLRQTIELVQGAAVAPEEKSASQPVALKLSPEKREALLAQFKVTPLPSVASARPRRFRWQIPAGIAAALVGVLALIAMLAQPLSHIRPKARAERQGGERRSDTLRWFYSKAQEAAPAVNSPVEVAKVAEQPRGTVGFSLGEAATPLPPPPPVAGLAVNGVADRRDLVSGSGGLGGGTPAKGLRTGALAAAPQSERQRQSGNGLYLPSLDGGAARWDINTPANTEKRVAAAEVVGLSDDYSILKPADSGGSKPAENVTHESIVSMDGLSPSPTATGPIERFAAGNVKVAAKADATTPASSLNGLGATVAGDGRTAQGGQGGVVAAQTGLSTWGDFDTDGGLDLFVAEGDKKSRGRGQTPSVKTEAEGAEADRMGRSGKPAASTEAREQTSLGLGYEPLPVKLPAPSFKGTPADLPTGPNIEPLHETLWANQSLTRGFGVPGPGGAPAANGRGGSGPVTAGTAMSGGAPAKPAPQGQPAVPASQEFAFFDLTAAASTPTAAGDVSRRYYRLSEAGGAGGGGAMPTVVDTLSVLDAKARPQAGGYAGGALEGETAWFGEFSSRKDHGQLSQNADAPILGDIPVLGRLFGTPTAAAPASGDKTAGALYQNRGDGTFSAGHFAADSDFLSEFADGEVARVPVRPTALPGQAPTDTSGAVLGNSLEQTSRQLERGNESKLAKRLEDVAQKVSAGQPTETAGKEVQKYNLAAEPAASAPTVNYSYGLSSLTTTNVTHYSLDKAKGFGRQADGKTADNWGRLAAPEERSPQPEARRRAAIALPGQRSELARVETREKVETASGRKLDAAPQAVVATAPAAPAAGSDVKKVAEDEFFAKRSVNAPVPQPEVLTEANPFSTFSLNVSDVSFKLAAASLEKGTMPDAAALRSEEFINAFDYRDPEPPSGVPVAFAWERGRYPFAHNRDLLRLSVKTAAAGRQAGKPLNLVLLVDNSGSMERADRVQIIRQCLRVLVDTLTPQDRVSVVTFSRTARLWVDGQPASQLGNLDERIGGLTPEGGTNLEEAMNTAYATAARHYLGQGVNRVVLLTDGAANLGNVEPDALKRTVETWRRQGIALDCFGIGWEGFNDDLLETLSRNGDGRYGFVNTPEEAATQFAGQLAGALRVAASDVKVQVEFNPRRVSAYRQVGYAKHQLKKEQFRDNTVDAAELGAAEAGTALYTVEVNPQGEGPLGTARVRFKVPGTMDYREHEWVMPYTGSAPALEQASPALRLAGGAGAFAEWLAGSPFAVEVNPDRLLLLLGGVTASYGADQRPKKLEWMIRQAKSISGQ